MLLPFIQRRPERGTFRKPSDHQRAWLQFITLFSLNLAKLSPSSLSLFSVSECAQSGLCKWETNNVARPKPCTISRQSTTLLQEHGRVGCIWLAIELKFQQPLSRIEDLTFNYLYSHILRDIGWLKHTLLIALSLQDVLKWLKGKTKMMTVQTHRWASTSFLSSTFQLDPKHPAPASRGCHADRASFPSGLGTCQINQAATGPCLFVCLIWAVWI